MAQKLIGASVYEQELYEHLTTHDQSEQEMLKHYEFAADSTKSVAFRYLVALIIDDEKRHHRLLAELADSLRVDVEFSDEAPRIPHLDLNRADHKEVLSLTRMLIASEKEDKKKLNRIGKELKDLKDTSLWSLLVDLMAADTAKHIRILDFVEHHIGR